MQRAYLERRAGLRQEICRRYYERHKEQALTTAKAYRGRDDVREKRIANAKVYRQDKRVDLDAYNAAWRAANPEKARAKYIRDTHIRRARVQGVEIENFSRADVYMRAAGHCEYCAVSLDPARWHLDHNIPIWRGGPHTFANAVASCPRCNLRKQTMTGEEFRVKLALENAS